MKDNLQKVLEHIRITYKSMALKGGRHYMSVNIGGIARKMGYHDIEKNVADREVIIALKEPQPGMKVRIDGRTFVRYAEYADGFAVAEPIAVKAGMRYKPYTAQNSMILNFT